MPFIFHSEKLSIFQSKPQNLQNTFKQKIQCSPLNKSECPSPIKYMATVCKDHPFRKLTRSNEKIQTFQENPSSQWNQSSLKQQRPFKKYAYKPIKIDNFDSKNQSKSNSFNLNHQNLHVFSKVTKDRSRIHKPTTQLSQDPIKKEKSSKKKHQNSLQNQQRLKYMVDKNPGPGAYDINIPKNEKTTVFYQGPSFNISLPEPKGNSLQKILLSIEQKIPKRQNRCLITDCSYKNQNSPSFKSSILNRSQAKKNEGLLNMLLSRKFSQNKENQSESTCQSRMAGTPSNQLYDDGYEKDQVKHPGPFTYDPNLQCNQQSKEKKTKPFLSGEPKNLSYLNRKIIPGPGAYTGQLLQNRQDFDQNQIKKPNKFDEYDQSPQNNYAFSSGVPRQLKFDTQNLCTQEFYYSPKNNISDVVQMRIQKGNRSSKSQFGSSLQRFQKVKIVKQDPFKYCFAKVGNSQPNGNCPSLTFAQKRQIFKPIQDTVAPNRYYNNANTIYKLTEKQLFRKLLQSKYQDEVILMKEKKNNMERVLIEENRKSINIKNPIHAPEEIHLDNYKEYLLNKKMIQKENIAFGYHKGARIDRTTEPRKQVDNYYETQPKWEVKSFNKEYGYEFAEK